jgi:rhomboid protease GluP
MLINAAVFVLICMRSGSILVPDMDTLLTFGAKDPVGLAYGEYWRLFVPMFLHIGIIHFAVNSYMLYAVGYQLESLVGGAWFLAIYLLAGVAGNIGSAAFTVNLSAGASTALFGLLGCGFYLERTVGRRIMEVTGRRPRNRVYTMTVLVNLALGIVVPFIDNAAHIGGLVAGVLLTFAMVNLRKNSLQLPRRSVGVAAILVFVGLCAAGFYRGTNPELLTERLTAAAGSTNDRGQQIYYLSQAVAIMPDDPELRLKRARLLFFANNAQDAYRDIRNVLDHEGMQKAVATLADELEAAKLVSEAWQVRRMIAHR